MKKKLITLFAIIALMALIVIPLTGCDGEPAETTNPLVELQNDFDELSANFDSEVANIKSRLSTLETSSIPANITNRVATLEANVAALQVTVNALSAGSSVDLTALTKAVNDIADDILEVNSNIDVISGNIDAINLDIADLKNKYNSITIPDYDSRIQEVELRIVSILSSVQNYGTDITDIKADILDMLDMIGNIALNTDNELNDVKRRLNTLESNNANKAEITYYSMPYIDVKINKTGNYALILTIYGNAVEGITLGRQTNYTLSDEVFVGDYGSPKTMKKIIIIPQNVTLEGKTYSLTQWERGQTYTVRFNIDSGSSITCIDIDTGVR